MPKYRFALVELFSGFAQDAYEDVGSLLRDTICAAPAVREQSVRSVLERLDGIDCPLVLFPGWTLVGRDVPQWVLDASTRRTLILEMLPADGEGKRSVESDRRAQAFVLKKGQVLVGPVTQLFWSSKGAGVEGAPSETAIELTGQLRGAATPDRRWRESEWPEAGLVLCGEVNVIKAARKGGVSHPLVDNFPSFDLIANPAHTRSTLPAMTWKREHLSRMRKGSTLISTANTHGQWVRWTEDGEKTGSAANQTAEAFCDGAKLIADESISVGSHMIRLYA